MYEGKQRVLQNLFLLLLLLLTHTKLWAQTPQFSQYYASPLYLNPALAGAEPNYTVQSIYRSQWTSIGTPYITTQGSFIAPFKSNDNHWGGTGISIFNDRAGFGNLNTLGINASFAYNVPLTADRTQILSFGVQGGIIQKRVDMGDGWGNQFNPFIGLDQNIAPDAGMINTSAYFPDFAGGAFWIFNPERDFDYKGFSTYAGFSAYHLNSPNESLLRTEVSRLPRLYRFHSGAVFRISDRANISPNILAVYQNAAHQINAGMYFSYRIMDSKGGILGSTDLIFGTWYRLQDALIFSTGLSHKFYTIGFSYDVNSSSLNYYTRGRGAYEISLSIRFGSNTTEKEIKSYSTPRI